MDDLLCFLHNPQLMMDLLDLTYYLKEISVRPPMIYLGAEIKKYLVRSGKYHWSMSSTQYLNNAINSVE